MGVRELVLEDDVKLAHVVLAKAVLIPAVHLEQQALLAHDGQVEDGVPFGVERLVDGGRGFLCVAKREDEVLRRQQVTDALTALGAIKVSMDTHGVRGAAAVLCSEVPALQRVLAWALAALPREHCKRTLITFALSISPGFACSMVRLGLPCRLVGTDVGVEL